MSRAPMAKEATTAVLRAQVGPRAYADGHMLYMYHQRIQGLAELVWVGGLKKNIARWTCYST